jgi:hypothetical protein
MLSFHDRLIVWNAQPIGAGTVAWQHFGSLALAMLLLVALWPASAVWVAHSLPFRLIHQSEPVDHGSAGLRHLSHQSTQSEAIGIRQHPDKSGPAMYSPSFTHHLTSDAVDSTAQSGLSARLHLRPLVQLAGRLRTPSNTKADVVERPVDEPGDHGSAIPFLRKLWPLWPATDQVLPAKRQLPPLGESASIRADAAVEPAHTNNAVSAEAVGMPIKTLSNTAGHAPSETALSTSMPDALAPWDESPRKAGPSPQVASSAASSESLETSAIKPAAGALASTQFIGPADSAGSMTHAAQSVPAPDKHPLRPMEWSAASGVTVEAAHPGAQLAEHGCDWEAR